MILSQKEVAKMVKKEAGRLARSAKRNAGKTKTCPGNRHFRFVDGKITIRKKAVSPLIATVLLIAFAVALGAVVMNWGRGYVDDTTQFASEKSAKEIRCSMDISMKFIEFSDVKQVCLDNGTDTINFTLQNAGTVAIEGVKIQAI